MRRLLLVCVFAAGAAWGVPACGPSALELTQQALPPEDSHKDDPDERRRAIEKLSARRDGTRDVYLKVYALSSRAGREDPAKVERYGTVRLAAVRALAKGHDPQYVGDLVRALHDPVEAVRVAAAAALDEVPGDEAMAPLTASLAGDQCDEVRQAAATALRHYRRREVLAALLAATSDRKLAVRAAAAGSLRELTGRDGGLEPAEWRDILREHPDPITAPAAARPWWDWAGATVKRTPAPAATTSQPASVPTTTTAPTTAPTDE